jgi:hypothetical protein
MRSSERHRRAQSSVTWKRRGTRPPWNRISQLLLAGALLSLPSAVLAQPLLRCGQPVAGELGAGSVDIYSIEQSPEDRVLVEAVDTSGNLGLLRLRARLDDGTIQETCSGSLALKTGSGLVSVSDCIPNLTGDQTGSYTVAMSIVSDSPGNCGTRLACGSSLAATAAVPGEVDAYTFPAYSGEVVTLRVMAAAANKVVTRLRVFDPDGVAVPVPNSTTCDSAVTVSLSRPGIHTVLVSACAAQLTGAYTLSLESRACPIALTIGNVVAPTDRMAAFRVFLHTLGQTVVAVQNDIDFGKAVPIAATDTGTPACRVNAKINKPDSTFAFRPGGCTPGVDCTGIRAVVFAAGNADPIADGSELYACIVRAQAPAVIGASYPLMCVNASANAINAESVPAVCSDGTALAAISACTGDCSDDDQVTVDELLTGVSIALGALPVAQCLVLDVNGDGTVTVDELLEAVGNALTGCEPSPTPVPADAAPTQPAALQADRG